MAKKMEEPRRPKTGAPEDFKQRSTEKGKSCRNLTPVAQASLLLADEPACYVYTDERGDPLFRVVRYYADAVKQFRQQKWDPVGERWLPRLYDARRVLYRFPELIAGVKAGRTVFVVEGEKDVEALRALGKVATCNPMGAGRGKFLPEFAQYFAGANVRIIQDQDPGGHSHALQVRKMLKPVAAKVRILEVQYGNDVSEHLEAGLALAFRPARAYGKISQPTQPPKSDPDPANYPKGDGRGIWAVLSRLEGVEKKGPNQWQALCPCPTHGKDNQDSKPSLSISAGTYRAVMWDCKAGCEWHEVLASFNALGIPTGEVM